jgi:hypothetical protein
MLDKFIECCYKDPDIKQFAIFTDNDLLSTKGEKGKELHEACLGILILAINIGEQFNAENLLGARFVSKRDQYSFKELGSIEEGDSDTVVFGIFHANSNVDLDKLIVRHFKSSECEKENKKGGTELVYRGLVYRGLEL